MAKRQRNIVVNKQLMEPAKADLLEAAVVETENRSGVLSQALDAAEEKSSPSYPFKPLTDEEFAALLASGVFVACAAGPYGPEDSQR